MVCENVSFDGRWDSRAFLRTLLTAEERCFMIEQSSKHESCSITSSSYLVLWNGRTLKSHVVSTCIHFDLQHGGRALSADVSPDSAGNTRRVVHTNWI